MTTAYSRAELIADGAIHAVGLVAGPTGVGVLLWLAALRQDALVIFACALYGAGLVTMLGLSAAYHLVRRQPLKAVLRRLDHAAIFVMIAGSYTPFALVRMAAPWGSLLFAGVWAIALLGIAIKLRCGCRYEGWGIALYLSLGWIMLVATAPLLDAISASGAALLGVGALLYTVGLAFHLNTRLPFHNAIWHGLVLVAAACHYSVILRDVALAAPLRGHAVSAPGVAHEAHHLGAVGEPLRVEVVPLGLAGDGLEDGIAHRAVVVVAA